MLRSKSTLMLAMLFSAFLGLMFVIGCGDSAEKKEMSENLKLYSNAVNEYEAADNTHRAELKPKIDAYKLKCSTMINELELQDKLTPQDMNAVEKEYKEITKKYESLSG